MNIVIVEDDHLQADWIRSKLEQGFPGVRLMMIDTERGFVSRFGDIIEMQPALVVMDVMLRWADPEPGLHLSALEGARGRTHRAGLRCAHLLQTREETRHIPVVLYTVLEKGDLGADLKNAPPTVVHLAKDSDAGPLLEMIQRLTRQ